MAAGAPEFFIWTTSEELGNAVLTMRKSLGLSRAELAQRAGVGNRFLWDLERGKGTLRSDKVMTVLLALGLMPLIVPVAALEVLR
jgi:transcriptional regulator with XRE-family HTH domain